ncbi:MAG: 50S ribosomal protein L25 [Lachnospiraceae bacterium]|nr:50S ribosomal protein L25 [Lachnospiraceae bacterium]
MNTLKAEKRSLSVKARKLRKEGYVTGNLFGRKLPASIPIQMTKKEVGRLLSTEKKGSQIMLNVEGEEYDVLIKDIEYDALQGQINEIDFQALVSNEKVHTTAEITFLNMDAIISGVFQIIMTEVPYRAYPSALVSEVKVDVGMLKIDDVIRVKDLEIAKDKDIELMIDPESVVASVLPVHNEIPEAEGENGTGQAAQ